MPPKLRQSHIEEFCYHWNSQRRAVPACARPHSCCFAQQEVVEISSESDICSVRSPESTAQQLDKSSSIDGLQGCAAIPIWTQFFWQCLDPEERKATQSVCYFIRSDVLWYCKQLPMWSSAQQRLLDPNSEEAESEQGAAFSEDNSLQDSEAGVVYHALPRKAG